MEFIRFAEKNTATAVSYTHLDVYKRQTIHYINEHYDEGNTVFQTACPVLPTDSPEDVAKKVHALEYEHFPRVIERVLCGE